MLGSILTRQYRFATRGIEIGLRTAQEAAGVAGDVAGAVAGHFGLGDGHHGADDVFTGEVMPDAEPSAPPPPQPTAAPPPPASAAPASPGVAPPPARSAPRPPVASEPAHVSREPELVEESAEPGAEDGAGAQVRVEEPWTGYRSLKARDVVARLPGATREELAAVELFELAHANRKSVVVAAQHALKKASPPR